MENCHRNHDYSLLGNARHKLLSTLSTYRKYRKPFLSILEFNYVDGLIFGEECSI